MESARTTSSTIQTLHFYDTEYCTDSVEWCPHEPHQNIFVCANYHLLCVENQKQERIGRILLFSIDPMCGLKLLQILKTPGILDQKWCLNKVNGYSILGVVNAKSTVEVYKLCSLANNDDVGLELLIQYIIADGGSPTSETLILSLDWSTGKYESESPEIICSDSKGCIHKLRLQNDKLELCNSWHAHGYEAWIAAFYYWNINVVFTGGDDAVLLQFDSRVGDSPVIKNRSHAAGVTSIHSNAKTEYVLASGSYDSYLRLWDIRHMKAPKTEFKMSETLWRLKWNPHNYRLLLAACMLGGVHIVNGDENVEIMESYYEHKNLSYGADWSYLNVTKLGKFDQKGQFLVATCSFYDHLLCVWMSNCMND